MLKRFWQSIIAVLVICFCYPLYAFGPINTLVAIPVAEGGYVARSELRYIRSSNGPLHLNLFIFPQIFVYGITEKLSVIGVIPLAYSDFNAPAGPPFSDLGIVSSTDFGVADIPLTLRYDIFKKDWVNHFLRVGLLGGLEIPTGDDPFSSHSIDFIPGVVMTYQSQGQAVDADFQYKINTHGNNVDVGDEILYDVSYSRRLLPWKVPEKGEKMQFNFVLELNGRYQRPSSVIGGPQIADSGGHVLFISPSVQWHIKNATPYVGVLVPIYQSRNGNQLRDDFTFVTGVAFNGVFF